MRRIAIVALALVVVVTAGVWVSAVRFKDEASGTDCGVPLGAAQHGRDAPRAFLHEPGSTSDGPTSGLFGGNEDDFFVTVCRGEARTRVAIAAGAIVVALGAVVLTFRKRWRGAQSPG